MSSRGDSQLLRQQLAAVQAERDELKEQSLPDDEVRSHFDAAELLQQLRAKNPKFKPSLKDIEAILDELGGKTPSSIMVGVEVSDLSAPFWDWLAIDPKDVLKRVEFGRGGAEILLRDIEAIVNYLKQYALRKISPRPMKQPELARRLQTTESNLNNVKNSETFPEWSQDRDPHGVKWEYRKGTFYPL